MKTEFKYSLDKRSRRITLSILIVVLGILGVITYSFWGEGTFITAWFLSFMIFIGLLYLLSMPRFIRVTNENIEIHCIVELKVIPLENIQFVRRIRNSNIRYILPMIGSYGFCGYYGRYYNIARREFIRLYASEWENFIQIEDFQGNKYVVSCSDTGSFVAAVRQAKEELEASKATN